MVQNDKDLVENRCFQKKSPPPQQPLNLAAPRLLCKYLTFTSTASVLGEGSPSCSTAHC